MKNKRLGRLEMGVDDVATLVVRAYGQHSVQGKWGVNTFYAPNDDLVREARRYAKENPRLAQEIAKFIMYGKYSPDPEFEREGSCISWHLKPEYVTSGIEILLEAGMPFDGIADELLKASEGRTPFNTIQKYVEGVSPYRDPKKQKFRKIYSALYRRLPELITPDLISQAVDHIMLDDEDYREIKPATSGNSFYNLVIMKQKIEDGTFESEIRDKLDRSGWDEDNIRKEVGSWYFGREYADAYLKWFIYDISFPLQVIEEFENEMSLRDFEEEYRSIKKGALTVKREGERLHESINKSLSELEQELISGGLKDTSKNPKKRSWQFWKK